MTNSMKAHWDKIYSSKSITQLGWYESIPTPSLQLIERCSLDKQATILDVGSGATTLLNALLERGYQNIYALDISDIALEMARSDLGPDKAFRIRWIVDDITHPARLFDLPDIYLWHDRAVFHFFTDDQQRRNYYSSLLKVLRPGGYVIMAAFAIGGATKCSGLNVRNYNEETLDQFFGSEFTVIDSMDYSYQTPSGEIRPYIYTLFQRKKSA